MALSLSNMFNPKTTTGKVVDTVLVGAALGLGLNAYEKAQEQKRVKAQESEYSKKYAFSNSCVQMKATLQNANLEMAQLNSENGGDAGAVRIRNRKKNALTKRIDAIKAYIPSLDCTQAKNQQLPQGQSAISSNIGKYALIGGGALVAIVLIANLVKK